MVTSAGYEYFIPVIKFIHEMMLIYLYNKITWLSYTAISVIFLFYISNGINVKRNDIINITLVILLFLNSNLIYYTIYVSFIYMCICTTNNKAYLILQPFFQISREIHRFISCGIYFKNNETRAKPGYYLLIDKFKTMSKLFGKPIKLYAGASNKIFTMFNQYHIIIGDDNDINKMYKYCYSDIHFIGLIVEFIICFLITSISIWYYDHSYNSFIISVIMNICMIIVLDIVKYFMSFKN